MSPWAALRWGTWDEPLVLGAGELAAVTLAHAIILGIAWARYRRVDRGTSRR